jgi:hypothetical protein
MKPMDRMSAKGIQEQKSDCSPLTYGFRPKQRT